MNLLQEPLQPQVSTTTTSTCNRHPDETHTTGFCASCLRERLAGLEASSSSSTTTTTTTTANASGSSISTHRKITTAAIKSIFRGSTTGNNKGGPSSSSSTTTTTAAAAANPSSSSFLPELRRCKSFSGRNAEGFSGVFEPQRKSCDVRGRSTLYNLFNKDEDRKVVVVVGKNKEICGEIEVGTSNLGFGDSVLEAREEEGGIGEEIRVPNVSEPVQVIEEVEEEEVVTMKDHIDHDSHCNKKPPARDLKEIAGSFWVAASVFSKKLQKWRRKQKMKKPGTGGGGGGSSLGAMRVNKPQSEIADYGYGRRSCDVDPRFSLDAGRMSLDAGRMSFDDPRYSWDEPRASWDGHLIGRTFPRLAPMVSVVEDLPPPPVVIKRSDNQIPVVEESSSSANGEDTTPGGSAQTRDYYSDSSQRRRKSFERSNSARKKAAALGGGGEGDETKSVSNAKVSPATIDHHCHGPKLIGTDRDLRDSKSNSLRDDRSESFESAYRDPASASCGVDQKGLKKSSSRWSKAWSIWSLIHRRNVGSKEDEEERYSHRGNVVERSYSESWQETRREVNGEAKGGANNRVLRSNSSVSSRHSFNTSAQFGSRRSNAETNNGHVKKRKEEVVLERSRSARYSPNDADNGLLRFYLTPSGTRRSGSVKNRPPKNTYSMTRRVLGLY